MKVYFQDFDDTDNSYLNISYCNDLSFPAHWHVIVEILYVVEGSICVTVNEQSKVLNVGEMVVCSSNDIHSYSCQKSKTILLMFHPNYVGSLSGWPKNMYFKNPFIQQKDLPKEILDNLYKLINLFKINGEAQKMLIKSSLYNICGNILSILPLSTIDTEKDRVTLLNRKRIGQAIDFIENRYTQEISLDLVADHLKISKYHFSRIFKKIVNQTLPQYINVLRINKAEYLIANTDKSIIDIAFECGYESVRSFNRSFLKLNKCTPTEFRNAKWNNKNKKVLNIEAD